MVVGLLIIMGIAIVGGIILGIANIVSGGKVLGERNLFYCRNAEGRKIVWNYCLII